MDSPPLVPFHWPMILLAISQIGSIESSPAALLDGGMEPDEKTLYWVAFSSRMAWARVPSSQLKYHEWKAAQY
jgi:hypothetical protein